MFGMRFEGGRKPQVVFNQKPVEFTGIFRFASKHISTSVSVISRARSNIRIYADNVFTPIRDLGIDLIIKKYVCPSGDTSWNKIETEKDCETCGKQLELITRFIQIKTRAIDDEGKFGYTLKTRDFTTDPRHVFLLYSDTIRRVWVALQHTIKKEQNERNKNDLTSEQFSYYFTQLATEAKKYRERKNLQEPGFTDLRQM